MKNRNRNLKIIISCFSTTLLVSLGSLVQSNVALAEFAHLCKEIHGEPRGDRYWMTARCLDDIGDYNEHSEIDVSEYVINRRHNLDWTTRAERPGMFNLTCRNIHIEDHDDDDDDDDNDGAGMLSADCENAQGTPIGTELDLNERIDVNDDGELVYEDPEESSAPKPDEPRLCLGPPGAPLGPTPCTKPI